MVDNLIRLFESRETTFDSMGIGSLNDAISCTITEELNGSFELEMTYPITGLRFADITLRRIIVSKSNPYSSPQAFRIYSITKPINGIITVNAEHISYDLSGYPISPFTANSVNEFFTMIKSSCIIECPFDFYTTKTNSDILKIEKPASIRSILGKEVLDKYGGEFEFDNFIVRHYENRGEDRNVTIRYGKNLIDLRQEENNSQVFTAVYPFYHSSTSESEIFIELTDKTIGVEGSFDYQRIYPLDLSSEFTDTPTEEDIRDLTNKYIEENNIGVPKVSLSISFVCLGKSNEYNDIAVLETVQLGDTVHVCFPKMNVTANSKCIKTKYNAITNQYIDVELGEAESSISSTIISQAEAIKEVPTKSFVDASIENATNMITGNLGGHIVIHSSVGSKKPNEILIMDTDDITTASNVWRWNLSGFGHSSNGYSGNYGIAITMDGQIDANYITTGNLEAISIRGCNIYGGTLDICDNFSVDSDGNVTATGTINATSGSIGGCTISDGVLQIANANISEQLTAAKINCSEVINAASLTVKQLAAEQIEATSIMAKGITVSNNSGTLLYAENNTVTIGAFSVDRNDTRSYIYCNDHDYLDEINHSGVYLGTDGLDLLGLDEDGNTKGNLKFRTSDGSLVVTGTITAVGGVIGGCEIDENGILQISSANISGKLTFDKLPDGTAKSEDIPTIPPIPNKISDLTNDLNFTTTSQVTYITSGLIATANILAENLLVKNLVSATGTFGTSTYAFTIGDACDAENSPCIYTRANLFAGMGGFGQISDNYVYIGGDGLSYWNGEINTTDYNTAIRPGLVFCSGCNNIRGDVHRATILRNGGIEFYYGGMQNLRMLTGSYTTLQYRIASMDIRSTDVYLSGSFIGSSSGSIVSDRSKKNSITDLDYRYSDLFDNLSAKLYKYNDGRSGRIHCGFIADEVKDAMDVAGLSTMEFAAYIESIDEDGDILKGLRYEEFIALCVKEIQVLKSEVNSLKRERNDSINE